MLSLRVPEDYSAFDVQRDRASAGQIPDLSGGQYRLADVLAALEWRRTVFEWFLDERFGDKVIVDVSRSNAEEWTTLSDMSVARGLLALDGFTPTWIMQRAGQDAHLWPGFREQPIFTCHVDEQFNWLKPVFLDPCWLVYYLANSALSVESNLQAAMIAAVLHSAGPEAVKIERQAEGAGVIVPAPRSFFRDSKRCLARRLRPDRHREGSTGAVIANAIVPRRPQQLVVLVEQVKAPRLPIGEEPRNAVVKGSCELSVVALRCPITGIAGFCWCAHQGQPGRLAVSGILCVGPG